MADAAQAKARKAIRKAQADFERSQERHEQIREKRRESFEQARAAGLSMRDIVKEALADELEHILSANEITPSAAANELEEIRQRVQRLASSLDQASSALDFFQFETEDLSPGEFEIGFLIPRNVVDSGLEQLGREFVELKKIITPFSELAGESRPEITIRSIASSEFQVFLDSVPAVAQ